MSADLLTALATEFCRETYGEPCPPGQKLKKNAPWFGWLGTAYLMLAWLDRRGMLNRGEDVRDA